MSPACNPTAYSTTTRPARPPLPSRSLLRQVQRSATTPFSGPFKRQSSQTRGGACTCRAVLTTERQADQVKPALQSLWQNSKWTQYKWTVYRGIAYDLTSFIDRHPAGNWLINLAIGRDCTALFESYHLRPRVAAEQLKRLPVLQDFPVDEVPSSPYPNDSDLYNTIRERVRREIFKGQDAKGAHRTGSEGAALAILGYATAACAAYLFDTNLVTGTLLDPPLQHTKRLYTSTLMFPVSFSIVVTGLAGAWIGLTIQHCGNHGAMSTSPTVNKAMGLTDDLIGGSSLMWRYHHQVSHHIHCNDLELDEDVFSAFPFLRFDARMPRKWFHKYQHMYMWATFPLLQLVFQLGDWQGLAENQTKGMTLHGANYFEKATVIAGKLIHYSIIAAIPAALHGLPAAALGSAAYMATQGVVLAATFAVSHNVEEAKPLASGSATTSSLQEHYAERDWGVQQVLTSANWGGKVGNFFTGGLNLQIEHHLFPAISFVHYPAIAKIVRDECEKRDIPYAHYDTLPSIVGRFSRYMQQVGVADQMPMQDGSLLQHTDMQRV